MRKVTLGRTGLSVCGDGFGALPIQRVSLDESRRILRMAVDGGIDFFDTARAYTDSEEKLGAAFSGIRNRVILATKSSAKTGQELTRDLETSLRLLRTDHIDVYQLHNPPACPRPGDGSGLYEAMEKARMAGKIRFIGMTNHRPHVAVEAVESGLYDTLQFPFCYLAGEEEIDLQRLCVARNVGFLAMKALSGGLITDAGCACAWIRQFPAALPLWGIQKESELAQFLSFQSEPPQLDAVRQARIEADRKELAAEFCRGCGYCMPCPAGIEIPICARIALLLRRAPAARWINEENRNRMAKVEECLHCGHCSAHCPYGLDTPALLTKNYVAYQAFLEENESAVPLRG